MRQIQMEVKINQFSSERKSEKQQAPAPNAVDFSMCSRVHLRKSASVDFEEKMTIRQLFQTYHNKSLPGVGIRDRVAGIPQSRSWKSGPRRIKKSGTGTGTEHFFLPGPRF